MVIVLISSGDGDNISSDDFFVLCQCEKYFSSANFDIISSGDREIVSSEDFFVLCWWYLTIKSGGVNEI